LYTDCEKKLPVHQVPWWSRANGGAH